jgi:hypothetical protein
VSHFVLVKLFDRANSHTIRRAPNGVQGLFAFDNRAIVWATIAGAFIFRAAFFTAAGDCNIFAAATILSFLHIFPSANHPANLVAVALAPAAIAAAIAAFVASYKQDG